MANPPITTGTPFAVVTNANPTALDSTYPLYFFWINDTSGSERLFMITDNTPASAIWKPLGLNTYRSYQINGIDGTTTGSTQIMTTESTAGSFYVTSVVIVATSISGLITVATVSVGTNATSYNNIVAATLLSGLNTTSVYHPVALVSNPAIVSASTPIFVNVTSAAIGSTYTFNVLISGYYS